MLAYLHFHTTGFHNSDEILRVGILAEENGETVFQQVFQIKHSDETRSSWGDTHAKALDYCGYNPAEAEDELADAKLAVDELLEAGFVPVVSGTFGARFLTKLVGQLSGTYVDAAELAKYHKVQNPGAGTSTKKVAEFFGTELDNSDPVSMAMLFQELVYRVGTPDGAFVAFPTQGEA